MHFLHHSGGSIFVHHGLFPSFSLWQDLELAVNMGSVMNTLFQDFQRLLCHKVSKEKIMTEGCWSNNSIFISHLRTFFSLLSTKHWKNLPLFFFGLSPEDQKGKRWFLEVWFLWIHSFHPPVIWVTSCSLASHSDYCTLPKKFG